MAMARTETVCTSLFDEAVRVFPGGAVGPSDGAVRALNPAVISESSGAYMHATDGRAYLDFVMGGSALILGHCHPNVVEAVARQLSRGTHYYQVLHEPAVRFASLLKSMIPCAGRMIFTSTGSDAVNQAIRIARARTGRDMIVRFEGAYHGTSEVALVAMQSVGQSAPRHADAAGIPNASAGLVLALPYGDVAAVEQVLAAHASRIAAVLVDPIQRWLKPDPDFLRGLRALCTEYDVLLIFDEVVSGFRLALGGAQEYFDVIPDLAAFGKIVGGGFPLGLVAGREEIMEVANPVTRQGAELVSTTGTFNGNVVACVAGHATVNTLATSSLHAEIAARGERLREGLRDIFLRYDIPAVVGGVGSFWQIHFSAAEPKNYDDVLRSDRDRSRRLDGELLSRGIFVIPSGRRSVSAAHTDEDVQRFLAVVEDICRDGRC